MIYSCNFPVSSSADEERVIGKGGPDAPLLISFDQRVPLIGDIVQLGKYQYEVESIIFKLAPNEQADLNFPLQKHYYHETTELTFYAHSASAGAGVETAEGDLGKKKHLPGKERGPDKEEKHHFHLPKLR